MEIASCSRDRRRRRPRITVSRRKNYMPRRSAKSWLSNNSSTHVQRDVRGGHFNSGMFQGIRWRGPSWCADCLANLTRILWRCQRRCKMGDLRARKNTECVSSADTAHKRSVLARNTRRPIAASVLACRAAEGAASATTSTVNHARNRTRRLRVVQLSQ